MAARVAIDLEHAVKLRSIFDAIRGSGIAEAYRGTPNARVVEELISSVGRDMYLALMRIVDSPGSDRASLPRLMEDLGDADLRFEVIRARAAILRHALNREPDTLLALILRRWEIIEQKHAALLERFRDHRDQYLAHNLMLPAPELLLTREVYRVMKELVPIVEDACVLLGADRPSFHHSTDVWYTRGQQFWRWLAAHPPTAAAETEGRAARSHTWRRKRR